MPYFGKTSKARLAECNFHLQDLFNEVIKHYDCAVLEGYRGKAKQNDYYSRGLSHLQFPKSKHNTSPSRAIDVIPYPVDWDDTERLARFAGFVEGVAKVRGIKIIWGGDWDRDGDIHEHSLIDYPHFELED